MSVKFVEVQLDTGDILYPSTDSQIIKFKNGTVYDVLYGLTYVKPYGELSISPSTKIYEKGAVVNGILLNVALTKGTENILTVKYYKNDVLIHTTTLNGVLTDSYIDANNVSADAEYYITISDGQSIVNSSKLKVNFICGFYKGVLTTLSPTSQDILNLTKILELKDNKTLDFTGSNCYPCLAYPSSYGDIVGIYDENNLSLLNSFNKTTISLSIGGSSVNYNVYILKNKITLSANKIQLLF
jgi:hypothetical protein